MSENCTERHNLPDCAKPHCNVPLSEHCVRVAYETWATHGCELANSNSLRSVSPYTSSTGVYVCMAVGEGFADNVEDDRTVLEKWNDTLFLSAACG